LTESGTGNNYGEPTDKQSFHDHYKLELANYSRMLRYADKIIAVSLACFFKQYRICRQKNILSSIGTG
jgi:hypothetical protein